MVFLNLILPLLINHFVAIIVGCVILKAKIDLESEQILEKHPIIVGRVMSPDIASPLKLSCICRV